MPGEKQNNTKQKLEQLRAVPEGFCFNEEQAWQKMKPKLRHKRRPLLWVPAAEILIVFFAGYLFTRSHQLKPQPAIAIVQTINKPGKTNAPLPAPASAQKTTTLIKPKTVSNQRMVMLPVVKVSGLPSTRSATLPLPETPIQSTFLPPVDTLLMAALPPKPRFKIAHVNELYMQPAPVPDETKKAVVFLIRKPAPVASEDALPANDNPIVQRKPRTLFSSSLNAPQ